MKPKIYWKIQQDCAGTILHVDKELMCGLGIEGAKDYYASKQTALKYMEAYANKVASMGMCVSGIRVMSGTFESC